MIANDELKGTITMRQATAQRWDIGIVGAGVAGASLAIHLATRGHSVLLIESQRFPREKVCGGCLNQRALSSLRDMEVFDDCIAAGAIPIDTLRIRNGTREHPWKIPEMLSIRRSTLDAILVRTAIANGAQFIDQTFASVGSLRQSSLRNPSPVCDVVLQLRSRDGNCERDTSTKDNCNVSVRAAIVAAGLTRSPLTQRSDWPSETDAHSRIGAQTLIPAECLQSRDSPWELAMHGKSDHELQMLIGRHGYLGISRADGDFYDFAAALDPLSIRRFGSISAAVDGLLLECGMPPLGNVHNLVWKSTPHLTRRSWPVAQDRIFLLGDAMGYIEPFTGEGMSWAMSGAQWLGEHLHQALSCSPSDQHLTHAIDEVQSAWNAWSARHRRKHQSICKWVAAQVRHPSRTAWALRGLDWLSPIRNILLRKATQ